MNTTLRVIVICLLLLVAIQTYALFNLKYRLPILTQPNMLPDEDEPMGIAAILAQISVRAVQNLEDIETIKNTNPQQLTPAQLQRLERIRQLQEQTREEIEELLEELE